jgi:hypothetical protein
VAVAVVVFGVGDAVVTKLVGQRFRWLRWCLLGVAVLWAALGIWAGDWWLVVAAVGVFGIWLSEYRTGVERRGGVVVVQNLVRRYEIDRDEIAYVDGKIRWRAMPRLVLTSGQTVPVVAFSDFHWQPGQESKDAWALANALQVPYLGG